MMSFVGFLRCPDSSVSLISCSWEGGVPPHTKLSVLPGECCMFIEGTQCSTWKWSGMNFYFPLTEKWQSELKREQWLSKWSLSMSSEQIVDSLDFWGNEPLNYFFVWNWCYIYRSTLNWVEGFWKSRSIAGEGVWGIWEYRSRYIHYVRI